jgi:hypothetical protein
MLSLFWLGAVFSAYLGYRLHDWWVPAAVACVVVAGQFALLQTTAGGGGPIAQLIGFVLMDLVMFYATFGIGRSIGQRLKQRRKGVR